MKTENELSNKIIGLAIEVHNAFGPGLLEKALTMSVCIMAFANQVYI